MNYANNIDVRNKSLNKLISSPEAKCVFSLSYIVFFEILIQKKRNNLLLAILSKTLLISLFVHWIGKHVPSNAGCNKETNENR